nr:MAG TPA: hypothetical protein [Caudoviricetes sp.]
MPITLCISFGKYSLVHPLPTILPLISKSKISKGISS